MKKIIVIISILVGTGATAQQEKHFSMFFMNQAQFNPAAAGHFGGDIRLFTNFRTQWFTIPNQAFRTISASLDGRLLEKKLNNGFIGAGVNFVNDVSGDGKYTVNHITIPLNYSIELNRTTYLSLGVQPGIYAHKLQGDGLYFQNQWTGSGFDSALPTGENLGGISDSKFDLSAGIQFVASPSKNRKFELGVSGGHLLKQDVSLYGIAEGMYRNITVFGKADLGNSFHDWSYHPTVIAMFQGPNRYITAGCNFRYQLRPASKHTMYFDGTSISFGFYHRVMDAFIGNIMYQSGPLVIGASYDLNISGLTAATNSVGAAEVFIKFTPSLGFRGLGAPRIH